MFRRLLLVGFVVFVALPATLLTVEHVRGRQELAGLLAEFRARGEVLELYRLIPPLVPSRSNGLPALVSATDRLQNLGQILPPAFFSVAPGRAVSTIALDSWPTDRGTTNQWPGLERFLADHGPELELLRTALEYPYRRPSLDWQQGAQMLLPHLSKYKAATMAVAACAVEAARRGDLDGTLAELEAMAILERDLETDPLLIGQLVRIACSSIASSRLWSIAQGRDWTEAELARLQQALPPSDLGPGVLRAIEGERAMGHYELSRLKPADLVAWQANQSIFGVTPTGLQMPESVDDAVQMAGSFVQQLANGIGTRIVFPLWRIGWGDQATAHYLRCLDDMLQAQRDAVRLQSLAAFRKVDLAERIAPNTVPGRLRGLYARMLVPALEGGLSKALRADTERNLQLTGIALRRYQLRHGRVPATLDALIPDFLPALPIDRMDGRPLRYRVEADGTFALWSVGDDLEDNGGDATSVSSSSGSYYWWRCRDAVWPRRASETEIAAWRSVEAEKLARRARSAPTTGTFTMSPELMQRYGLMPRNAGPSAPATNAPATPADPSPSKP